jgi:putative hydrolase of the HAD superfamily
MMWLSDNSPYRHLIIDLGAVLFAIDIPRSVEAFAALAGRPVAEMAPLLHDPLFLRFERGEETPDGFRNGLRERLGRSISDAELDAAWNALLLGVIPGRVELVAHLAKSFDVVLLSNTNQIHFDTLSQECEALFSQFGACHFSFRMGLRKPDPAIYHKVLALEGWDAQRTVLIDDGEANVQAARAIGMGGLLFTAEDDWGKWGVKRG